MSKTKFSQESFQILLSQLDSDLEKAGEIYLNLHRRLTMFFSKRSCASKDIDELADEVIDRLGKSLAKGVEIENLNAYSLNTAKFVLHEYWRNPLTTDEIPETPVLPDQIERQEVDQRLVFLRNCIEKEIKNKQDITLIVGYYNPDQKAKDVRKKLMEFFNINSNHLKQKAFKLRKKLENCINDCVEKAAGKEVF